MSNNNENDGSIIIVRDAGYSKAKLLSPEYQKEVQKRIDDPTISTGKYRLKDLYAERGILVNPEAITILYDSY